MQPQINDLKPYLRSGEHCVVSTDGNEKRWFGVRRCIADDGAIIGWLVAHGGRVWGCPTPLELAAAIEEMFAND